MLWETGKSGAVNELKLSQHSFNSFTTFLLPVSHNTPSILSQLPSSSLSQNSFNNFTTFLLPVSHNTPPILSQPSFSFQSPTTLLQFFHNPPSLSCLPQHSFNSFTTPLLPISHITQTGRRRRVVWTAWKREEWF